LKKEAGSGNKLGSIFHKTWGRDVEAEAGSGSGGSGSKLGSDKLYTELEAEGENILLFPHS